MGKLINSIMEENWKDRDKLEREAAKKFELWDKSEGKNLDLLFDPTIWAYAFLKDKEGNKLKLYGFQDKIINDKNRFVAVAASNQIGKSFAVGVIKAVHHALHVPNASVGIISKSDDQAKFVLDEIKRVLNVSSISFKEIIGDVENRSEIHFKGMDNTTAIIITSPPTTSIAGFPFTLIVGDEIALWEMKIADDKIKNQVNYYNQILEPRTNSTKNWKNEHFTLGQIILISNPWGQTGLLWHTFKNDERYNCYQFCWLAKPLNTYEEYIAHKNREGMSRDEFDSVFAARFSSNVGGFITLSEWNRAIKEDIEMKVPFNDSISLGGDFAGRDTIGKDVDDNVMYGNQIIRYEEGPKKLRLCYQGDFGKRTEKRVIYDEIKRLSENNNINCFAYDKVGVSDSIKDDLMDENILNSFQIESLSYSLQNKSAIYNNLKSLFEQGRLEIPSDVNPKLKEQLLGLRFERTEGVGHLKIHHASEKIHDDHADAFANACWAASRLLKGEVSINYIESNSIKTAQEYFKRVVCLGCGEDWDYGDEEECIFCGAKSIAEYITHKPIK